MQLTLYFTVVFIAGAFCEDKYTSKYDNVDDVQTVLKNERLLKNYLDCLLEKAKCSSDAAELKKHIPEALETECAKCSEKHKQELRTVVKYLAENKKDSWNELLRKYDPKGTYKSKYEALRKEEEIESGAKHA